MVAELGDQNQEALAELYRRHSGAVWAVAKQVCGVGSLAEQVCEAIFTELWSHPERFDPSLGSLRSWLVAQTRARAVEVARPDQGDQADQAVDRLPTAERDTIVLTYLGGLSCREASRVLGVSEETVKRHIRLGLVNLRRASNTQGVTQ